MNASQGSIPADRDLPQSTGWRELWLKEDWWAVWLGLALVVAAYFLFASGSSLKWIAVTPVKWSHGSELAEHFLVNWTRYLAQFPFCLRSSSDPPPRAGRALPRVFAASP